MTNPNPIGCLDPTSPLIECSSTQVFGVPRGRPNRNLPNTTTEIPISGISLHCVKDTFEGYIAKLCPGSTRLSFGCHSSLHYVIDAETGNIVSLVPESDIAWAWQDYRGNFPAITPIDMCPCPEPCPIPPCGSSPIAQIYTGWTVLSAQFPNLSADFYTINIGVISQGHPEQSRLDNEICCIGPYGMSQKAYDKLVQLLAWIQFRYSSTILLDTQHIAFEDEIVSTEPGCMECQCGANGACLICDVSAYCERCHNAADPTISTVSSLVYIFGENDAGCRVKISLQDFITLITG